MCKPPLPLLAVILLSLGNLDARETPLIIEKPSGGEVYFPGQTQTVLLDLKTRAKSVLIELSRDGGLTFETLGTVDNTIKDRGARNRLTWTVAEPFSTNGQIRATSSDTRKPGSGLSGAFSIGAATTDGSGTGLRFVLKSGDSMTGPLVLNGDPANGLHATTKKYVDNANSGQDTAQAAKDGTQDTGIAARVAKAGDAMSGPLVLVGDPTANLHPATKQYVDNQNNAQDTGQAANDGVQDANIAAKVAKAGDTMTGALTLNANPTANLHAATKQYVDATNGTQDTTITGKVSKAGDTMTGALTLSGAPTADLHAATKKYTDDANTAQDSAQATTDTAQDTSMAGKVGKAGDTMTGNLKLPVSGPVANEDAATKKYVDDGNAGQNAAISGKLSVSGGTMTGTLTLNGGPTVALQAASKQYVDDTVSNATSGTAVWKTSGNTGTAPGTHYLGTTDNQALIIKVNNQRAMRIEPGATSPNLIGGYDGNGVTNGIVGAVIGGGGATSEVNWVTGNHGTVGGGLTNVADYRATVGGGLANRATGIYASVGGGEGNSASNWFGTIPGGYWNSATGKYSFAAGRHAKANHDGALVWADSNTFDFNSTAANEFSARATGGVRFVTAIDGGGLPTKTLSIASNGDVAAQGVIESKSGGVKFPDGTVQTTALVGAGVPAGYLILGDSATAPTGYTHTGDVIDIGGNSWASAAAMPTARGSSGFCVLAEKIYVIGGQVGVPNIMTGIAEVYDPSNDTWTSKAAMPTARRGVAAATVGGKIYVMGGFTGSYLATTEEYDPSTNTWSTKASMPTAREGAAVAVVNNLIYVIGGNNGASDFGITEVYDPATNTWATKASMSQRNGPAAAVIADKIYVMGGHSGAVKSLNQVYDPQTDTWQTKAPMPTSRMSLVLGVVNGNVYAIGGHDGVSAWLTTTERYDPSSDSWVSSSAMSKGRSGASVGVVGGKIYVVGGYNNVDGHLAIHEVYTPGKVYYIHQKD